MIANFRVHCLHEEYCLIELQIDSMLPGGDYIRRNLRILTRNMKHMKHTLMYGNTILKLIMNFYR